MRTLDRNKISVWIVNPTGTTEKVDSNGFYTGEIIKTYSTPIKVRLSMYPASGDIVEEIFGKDVSYDMVSLSNEVQLSADTLIFLTQPTGNYATTYHFRVDSIMKSINTFNYGLKSRT